MNIDDKIAEEVNRLLALNDENMIIYEHFAIELIIKVFVLSKYLKTKENENEKEEEKIIRCFRLFFLFFEKISNLFCCCYRWIFHINEFLIGISSRYSIE